MNQMPSLLYGDLEDDLRTTVRDFVADRAPIDRVLARCDHDAPFGKGAREAWSGLVGELGVAGLALTEEEGGAGASWSEVAVVLEELGRGVVDVPFYTSAVLATTMARTAGAASLLRQLAAGEAIGTIVAPWAAPLAELPGLRWDGHALSGSVAGVAGAAEATHLLVPLPGTLLLVAAEQASIVSVPSLDLTRRVAEVTFENAEASAIAEGAEVGAAVGRTADIGAALLASEQLGLAEQTLTMTLHYLKERRQFGRILGSYQALKHRLADVWTSLAQARAVARYAAACAAAEEGPYVDDLPIAAALAQAVCGSVAVRSAEESVQLHGGLGFTWEHPAHLYLKRARADALAFGTPAWHRHRLADLTGLPRPVPA